MGGMGAKEQNFHKNVFDRMGYAAITDEVQELFLAGKRDEATALIPDDLVEDMHIVGDAGYVKERVAAWEETGVTTLLLSLRSADEVRPGRRDAGVTGPDERNVLGEELQLCGTDPMTGFYRDGCCSTGPEDLGSHTICAVVTTEFLEHQRSIGNDLSTPNPVYGFPGLNPGDRWCVTAAELGAGPQRRRWPHRSCSPRPTRPCSRSCRSRCSSSTPSTYRATSAGSTPRPARAPPLELPPGMVLSNLMTSGASTEHDVVPHGVALLADELMGDGRSFLALICTSATSTARRLRNQSGSRREPTRCPTRRSRQRCRGSARTWTVEFPSAVRAS